MKHEQDPTHTNERMAVAGAAGALVLGWTALTGGAFYVLDQVNQAQQEQVRVDTLKHIWEGQYPSTGYPREVEMQPGEEIYVTPAWGKSMK